MGEIHQISGWNALDFKGEIPHPAFIKLKSFCWNTCFYNLGGFHRWNLGEICQISWVKSTRFQGEMHWISRVKSPTLHSSNWRVFAETLAFINFGFHRWYLGEIRQISPEIRRISRISWNPPDFTLKSVWNLPDFMKSVWNLPDFRVKSIWNPPDFMKSIWNLLDFMKSAGFHEIHMKSTGFHEIHNEICNVSFCVMIKYRSFEKWKTKHRVTIPCKWSFDFMKSGGFHVNSTQNLIKANVSTKPVQFDECRRGAMNQDFMKSWFIAPSLHPPNWRVFVETSDFIRFWVDFKNMSFCVMIKYRSFFRKTKHIPLPIKHGFIVCVCVCVYLSVSVSVCLQCRGVDLVRGGVDSRGGYVSKVLYVKTKESGPLGGRGPGTPLLRSANGLGYVWSSWHINFILVLLILWHCDSFSDCHLTFGAKCILGYIWQGDTIGLLYQCSRQNIPPAKFTLAWLYG